MKIKSTNKLLSRLKESDENLHNARRIDDSPVKSRRQEEPVAKVRECDEAMHNHQKID